MKNATAQEQIDFIKKHVGEGGELTRASVTLALVKAFTADTALGRNIPLEAALARAMYGSEVGDLGSAALWFDAGRVFEAQGGGDANKS